MVYLYGEQEIAYLKNKDKALAEVIRQVGHIERTVDSDLFSSVVHHIVGQQISTAAQATIWRRMQDALPAMDAAVIAAAAEGDLQRLGLSFRKVGYIQNFARLVQCGALDLQALWDKSDDEVIAQLSALPGIGRWTAEMLLIFCMQRPDVLSYGDLAIQRGLRMLYHHRRIDAKLFAKYKKRYSPYGTVASLYLWAVAGGKIEGMRDYLPKQKSNWL